MLNAQEAVAAKYKRIVLQQQLEQSPSRKVAVQALMTSPDNPFGHNNDQLVQQASYANRFESNGGRNDTGMASAASPESGAKKTLYS